MGVGLDNTSEKKQDLTAELPASADEAPLSHATRRKFARNVVVGGAVFVSLGNRAAWGAPEPGCMSVVAFDSFNNATNFASFSEPVKTLGQDIIAVQSDTNHTLYPNLRVVDDGNQICIVEVEGAAPVTTFSDSFSSDNLSRERDRFSKKNK